MLCDDRLQTLAVRSLHEPLYEIDHTFQNLSPQTHRIPV